MNHIIRKKFFLQQLTSDEISAVALSNDHRHFETVLNNIIQPRIAGTPGHEVVKDSIVR